MHHILIFLILISTWTDIGEDHKTTMFFVNLYGNIIAIFSLFLYKLKGHLFKSISYTSSEISKRTLVKVFLLQCDCKRLSREPPVM